MVIVPRLFQDLKGLYKQCLASLPMRWTNAKLRLKMGKRSSNTLHSLIKAKHQVNGRGGSCSVIFCYQPQTSLPFSISKIYCDTITFLLLWNRNNDTVWKSSYW